MLLYSVYDKIREIFKEVVADPKTLRYGYVFCRKANNLCLGFFFYEYELKKCGSY